MNFLLVIFLLVVCAIMVYLFFKVPGNLIAKVFCTCLMLYISSSVYFSFDSYRGWPVWYNDGVTVNGALVVNIMMVDQKDGAIYVTAIPCVKEKECFDASDVASSDTSFFTSYLSPYRIFGYIPVRKLTPRIYEFPYNEQTRKMFADAQEQMQQGANVFLKDKKGKLSAGKDGSPQDGDSENSGKAGQMGPDNTKGGYIEGLEGFTLEVEAPFNGIKK